MMVRLVVAGAFVYRHFEHVIAVVFVVVAFLLLSVVQTSIQHLHYQVFLEDPVEKQQCSHSAFAIKYKTRCSLL